MSAARGSGPNRGGWWGGSRAALPSSFQRRDRSRVAFGAGGSSVVKPRGRPWRASASPMESRRTPLPGTNIAVLHHKCAHQHAVGAKDCSGAGHAPRVRGGHSREHLLVRPIQRAGEVHRLRNRPALQRHRPPQEERRKTPQTARGEVHAHQRQRRSTGSTQRRGRERMSPRIGKSGRAARRAGRRAGWPR